MLKTEYPYTDKQGNEHKDLIKHHSDEGNYILQNETGIKYGIAIDVYPCRYTYSETDEKIPIKSEAEGKTLEEQEKALEI